MRKLVSAVVLSASLAPAAAFAEGFGLIEYTTEGVAMSGAAMFIENDAGNMAYNPVGITKCEGSQIKVSATNISPSSFYDAVKVGGGVDSGHNRSRSAWAPGAYYVKKIDDKQWWGIGCFSRFGNMCNFEGGSIPATNNRFAKVMGLSITPTYAHKSGRKFYWAVGADVNYAGLVMEKDFSGHPTHNPISLGDTVDGHNKTQGESVSLGWNAGLRYAVTDKDEFGFAYRSRISHTLDADFDWYGVPAGLRALKGLPEDFHSTAHGKVILPDSYHFGYSHKFDQKNRVELSAIRTNWSNFKSLNLNIDGFGTSSSAHNWKDGWRYAIGYEHHFSKKYTGMLGFSYDGGCIPYVGGGFMVPMGCRRTYSIGLKYHDRRHTVACAFAWMSMGDLSFAGNGSTDGYVSAHAYDNTTKVISIGYAYHF